LPPDPTEDNEAIREKIKEKVKECALKKMATQFQSFKKRLSNDFIKKGRTPEFTGPLEKLKNHWTNLWSTSKVFFLDAVFLPEGTGKSGYRKIS
jgi:hypothetical protein